MSTKISGNTKFHNNRSITALVANSSQIGSHSMSTHANILLCCLILRFAFWAGTEPLKALIAFVPTRTMGRMGIQNQWGCLGGRFRYTTPYSY